MGGAHGLNRQSNWVCLRMSAAPRFSVFRNLSGHPLCGSLEPLPFCWVPGWGPRSKASDESSTTEVARSQVVAVDFRAPSAQGLCVSRRPDPSMGGLLVGSRVLGSPPILYLLVSKCRSWLLKFGNASGQGSAVAHGWTLPLVGFWV